MIRYRYLTQLQPPAPFVYLTLRNPVSGTVVEDVPAQVDTAADRTLLPQPLVEDLALPQIGSVPIGGVGGIMQLMSTYPVDVAIRDLPSRTGEVIASAGEGCLTRARHS